jgi:hypothetical protein
LAEGRTIDPNDEDLTEDLTEEDPDFGEFL